MHSFQIIEDIDSKSNCITAQIQELIEDYVKISRPYLLHFPRNKPSKSVTVGTGRVESDRLIVLNLIYHLNLNDQNECL